ncbi:hypothetical protein ACFQHO_04475 [Actinomadura yumaensis]|uniref:hypothetical protein n=1 Tax=Actinomadura TaxID=1988 RepID=UPI00132C4B12|nr:hypothetical protein [Actinomadura sp. J1-007]MWK37946.1 hypothetical protein [Actinomadura sp. J1-007]
MTDGWPEGRTRQEGGRVARSRHDSAPAEYPHGYERDPYGGGDQLAGYGNDPYGGGDQPPRRGAAAGAAGRRSSGSSSRCCSWSPSAATSGWTPG